MNGTTYTYRITTLTKIVSKGPGKQDQGLVISNHHLTITCKPRYNTALAYPDEGMTCLISKQRFIENKDNRRPKLTYLDAFS